MSRACAIGLLATLLSAGVVAGCSPCPDGQCPAAFERLELQRSGAWGFCPELGSPHALVVEHRREEGRFAVRGTVITEGDPAAGDDCLERINPAGACYVDVPVAEALLSVEDSARLIELVEALGPTGCEIDGACEPCVSTDVAVDGVHRYAGGCAEPSASCDAVEGLVAFLDSLAP